LKWGIAVKARTRLSNGRKIAFLNVNKSRNLSGKLDVAAGHKFFEYLYKLVFEEYPAFAR